MKNFDKKTPVSNYQTTINWQALAYFNFYRIILSGLFLLLVYIGHLPQPLGSFDQDLFSMVCHGYLFIAIVFLSFKLLQLKFFNDGPPPIK